MRHRVTLLSLAFATASAVNVHHHHAGHPRHQVRDVVWVTEVEVQTIVDWQTLGVGGGKEVSDTPSSTTSAASTFISSIVSVAASPVANIGPSSVSSPSSEGTKYNPDGIATATASSLSASSSLVASSAALPASGKTSESSGKAISIDSLSPNGRKAGLSGYVGIQQLDAFADLAPYISWYSDYTPDTPTTDNVTGVGMLWGANGSPCGNEVSKRLGTFKDSIVGTNPDIMFGFYEPDCYCADSSDMNTASGTSQWNELIAPLGKGGTVLGSPSMCKQKDETWLGPFRDGGLDHDWDVTSVHINKPDLAGIMEDIDYYASTYMKPIWVSEFACVHDEGGWNPCTDQGEIDQFINDAVKFFEGNDTVVAYGPSNGNGLGNVWPLTDASGELTASGITYLNALKNL